MYVFTLVRKRVVICAVGPILIIPIKLKVFTRHLNMEYFQSAVPAIFLSYVTTLFLCFSFVHVYIYK